MLICQKCGAYLVDGAIFCSECGTRLIASPQQKSKAAYAGTYLLETPEVTVTLLFEQDANGKISGILSSTKGTQLQLEGQVKEDAAVGLCYDSQGKAYFEAHQKGNKLMLALIESNANNMPDYNKVQQLILTKQEGAESRASTQPAEPLLSHPSPPSTNIIEDPNGRFRFPLPEGWKSQKADKGIMLGHAEVAGTILILPHMARTFQEVQHQMLEGIVEEGTYLALEDNLQSLGNNILAGNYIGLNNSQQIKARGIGTLSPNGGGVYILAITTPDQFSSDLLNTAEGIALEMHYVQPSPQVPASNLMQYFAGTWVNYTRNTETRITFAPTGEYFENYEASYGGQFGNQYGVSTGGWGTARQNRNQGHWTVRGNREQGQIIITFQDGRQTTVNYQVHIEKGQTYWNEYVFNGELYGRQQ